MLKDVNFPPSLDVPDQNLFSFDMKAVAGKAPYIDALQKFFKRYNPSGRI